MARTDEGARPAPQAPRKALRIESHDTGVYRGRATVRERAASAALSVAPAGGGQVQETAREALEALVASLRSDVAGKEQALSEAEAAKLAAEVEKLAAERERTVAETANKAVEAQYSATQTAALLAQMPQVSAMADALLLSAGYEDRDAPPIVPAAPAAAPVPVEALPQNTRPLTPANPGIGRRQGIETRESPG